MPAVSPAGVAHRERFARTCRRVRPGRKNCAREASRRLRARARAYAGELASAVGNLLSSSSFTFMNKVCAETGVERLARYRRKAQKWRDQAAHDADAGSRYHHIALAEYYDLLIMLENESARAG